LDRSAIILANGSSSGFAEDKGLVMLNSKPLLNHMIDAVKGLVEETIIVATSEAQANLYRKIAPNIEFAISHVNPKNEINDTLRGFEAAHGKYSLLLPFNAPFVSREITSLLFELCTGKSAAVPRYTSYEIEPLQAVYNTAQALEATQTALTNNEADMAVVVDKMRGVRYVSMLVFEQLDPEMKSFFRVNSLLDLKKAASMLKSKS
jgi:molybdenum cofactor guanylyltransferase